MGVCGLITVFAAYVDLGHILLFEDEFTPRLQLKPVSLTFYLSFLLAWLWTAIDARGRWVSAIVLAITAITAYVTLSEERSAFIGLICALACLGILVLRTRAYLTMAFVAGALTILAEAQFSISYASREFGIYAFTCFAAMLHLAHRAASRPTHPVAHCHQEGQ